MNNAGVFVIFAVNRPVKIRFKRKAALNGVAAVKLRYGNGFISALFGENYLARCSVKRAVIGGLRRAYIFVVNAEFAGNGFAKVGESLNGAGEVL